MKPLVVIPARGGSKGVPKKNIKLLEGKPLIQYTIEAAREVFSDEVICVSTDDFIIKSVVESLGLSVPFIRPAVLATDTASTNEVLLHAIHHYESQSYFPDTLILLQVTTPFRKGKHIKEALELFDENTEMVVSVKETNSNPYYVLFEENIEGWLERSKKGFFLTRQECPKVWQFNGGIYIIDAKILKERKLHDFVKVRKYVMDDYSSHDIDSLLDWEVAEVIVKKMMINES